MLMEIDKDQLYHKVFSQSEKMEKRLAKKTARLKEIDVQMKKLAEEKATLEKEVALISNKNAASAYTNFDQSLKTLGIDFTNKETFGKMMEILADGFEKFQKEATADAKAEAAAKKMEENSIDLFNSSKDEASGENDATKEKKVADL